MGQLSTILQFTHRQELAKHCSHLRAAKELAVHVQLSLCGCNENHILRLGWQVVGQDVGGTAQEELERELSQLPVSYAQKH